MDILPSTLVLHHCICLCMVDSIEHHLSRRRLYTSLVFQHHGHKSALCMILPCLYSLMGILESKDSIRRSCSRPCILGTKGRHTSRIHFSFLFCQRLCRMLKACC